MNLYKSKKKAAEDLARPRANADTVIRDFARFQCLNCAKGKPEQSGYKPSAEGVGMVQGLVHRVKKNIGLGRIRDGFVACRAAEMWRAHSEFK